MKSKKKKKSFTLIEIMIVILLIGLIGGALAFNMRGSMDKGRIFKSQQNATRVYNALMMEYAKGEQDLKEIVDGMDDVLKNSPFVKESETVLKDGWGKKLKVEIVGDDLCIYSEKAKLLEDAKKTPSNSS